MGTPLVSLNLQSPGIMFKTHEILDASLSLVGKVMSVTGPGDDVGGAGVMS